MTAGAIVVPLLIVGGAPKPMQDPHVEAMIYEVGTGDGVSFGSPPAITITNRLGVFELCDGKLTALPADHYADEAEARAVLDPFLKAWEIDADLSGNIGAIRFKFHSVRKVDRDPPAPASGAVSVMPGVGELILTGFAPSVHITQNTYPPPPRDFRITPELEMAYARWKAFRQGREPLQSMAYAVLTLAEDMAGGRQHAASTFHMEKRILDTLGRLSSTKGDGISARKLKQVHQLQALSGAESRWLEAAVRRVIWRIGARASGAQLAQLTMSDLPSL